MTPTNLTAYLPSLRGPVIGIVGRARSGKDTVFEIAQRMRPGVSRVAFADPLKEIAKTVYDFTDDQLWGKLKDAPDRRYPRPDGTFLTPREACQRLGTEWGRTCYPDTWIHLAFRRANELFVGNQPRRVGGDGSFYTSWAPPKTPSAVFITDVRFVNEAQAIVERGGEVWRLASTRPGVGLIGAAGDHPSEADMFTAAMDEWVAYEITNDGPREELDDAVLALLYENSL